MTIRTVRDKIYTSMISKINLNINFDTGKIISGIKYERPVRRKKAVEEES